MILKLLTATFTILFMTATLFAQQPEDQLEYFFKDEDVESFDDRIPSPQEFLGYELGSHHTRHDQIVAYFRKLGELSDRAEFNEIGQTYGHRPLINLKVTSQENHANLDDIRETHLQANDPQNDSPDPDRPAISYLGYGVHGNETSSSETAMLTAYYLIAGEGDPVDRYLEEGVFIIDPVMNPDGRDRHTHWANMHKGNPPVADPLDREHNEAWPGGRTNHYWFDLNRDWLPIVHPESQARVDLIHRWKPNVATDFHEMGTTSTYFFEPTKPEGSWNPTLPEELYTDFTLRFADHWADYLDDIGSLYFTKEIFDNSYPGYGSTYPNFMGGLGLVFEQASARGHVQENQWGELTFEFAIRNHLRTSLGTIKAAIEEREYMQDYQRRFFESALEEAGDFETEAYIFGDPHDTSRNREFLGLLLNHRIEVYELSESVDVDGTTFDQENSWIVPVEQEQFRLVRTIFETAEEFADSVFYDASTWTMSLAYGLPNAEYNSGRWDDLPTGSRVTEAPEPPQQTELPVSQYAYLLDWSDYYAPKALYHLLDHDVIVQSAFEPTTIETNQGETEYSRGSLMVPVQPQDYSPEELHSIVLEAAHKAGVEFQSTSTGYAVDGVDLGSRNVPVIEKPKAFTIVGSGTSSYGAGQLWHLLDTKVNMPITKVDRQNYSRISLEEYDVAVFVSGNYGFLSEDEVEDLQRWIRNGGTLITIGGAAQWAVRNELTSDIHIVDDNNAEEEEEPEIPPRLDYEKARDIFGAQRIGGIILETDLDITHPLGYGYHDRQLPVWRSHTTFYHPSENPYSTVAQYTASPLMSGYISDENLEAISETASILVDQSGSGRVILMADNPKFRGYWFGTNKLLLNAIFFGQHISVPAAP